MTKLATLASAACVLAGFLAPCPVMAQVYTTVPQASDADRLAGAMRTIGANPQDVDALTTAGELSLRVGDAAGAAALLARAEKIQPMNGRVKAGMGSILVHEERPGAALRYFDQAEGYGWSAERFAAERGFAYDLIGEQERAQRDYRLAIRSGGTNDEVTRRYALSLGISGKREMALEQIDALIRRGDRGAWRARAFILAMNGDVAGAEKIATSMMPPGAATGLQPFFVRLSALPAADRAFAVHFGETRPTPARIADARLTPTLATLGPDPYAPRVVDVAAVAVPPVREDRRRDRRRPRRETQVAAIASPVVAAPGVPAPPAYSRFPALSAATAVVQALPAPSVAAAVVQALPAPVTVVAARPYAPPARPVAVPGASLPAQARAVPSSATLASASTIVPSASTNAVSDALPTVAANAVTIPAATGPYVALAPVVAAAPRSSVPVASAPAAPASAPVAVAAASPRPVPMPGFSSEVASVSPASGATPPVAVSGPSDRGMSVAAVPAAVPVRAVASTALPGPPRGGGDTILARIIANISVPGAELDVAPVRPAPVVAVVPQAVPVARATPDPRPAQLAALRPATAGKPAPTARPLPVGKPVPAAVPTPEAKPDARTRAATRAAERKAAERAATAKKVADEKALAAKRLAEEKRAARADPPRIWVQVAGGATEGDLPKAFATVKAKAPALAGRAAYATPLRATNRVLTGPFKSDAEARALVNQLAKQGVSAFTFTSTQGQKVTRLPAK